MFINKKSENLTMSVFWQLLYVEPDPSLKVNTCIKEGVFFLFLRILPQDCAVAQRDRSLIYSAHSLRQQMPFPHHWFSQPGLGDFCFPWQPAKRLLFRVNILSKHLFTSCQIHSCPWPYTVLLLPSRCTPFPLELSKPSGLALFLFLYFWECMQ